MLFAKYERTASESDALQIPVEDGVAGFTSADREMLGFNCQQRARRKSDEIVGVGQQMGFIEIVDAPYQPAFRIAPCSKILNVEIPDRQQSWGLGLDSTDVFPDLKPTIE